MKRKAATAVQIAAAGLLLVSHTEISTAQPILDTSPEAQATADGLYPVHPALMTSAWVHPDVDLSDYTAVFFLPTIVQYRDVGERSYSFRKFDNRSEFPVSEQLQGRLSRSFGEMLFEAVSNARTHELSSEPGRGVLMIRGFLTDVVSGVPPDLAGSNISTVRWAYDANVLLELRDSMSDVVLARTFDHQRIEGPFDADEIFALTPQIARAWSALLVRRLRELGALYPSRLQRLQEQSQEQSQEQNSPD